jgi:hypothetical protein
VTFVDAFSRYVVHHRLLVDLNGVAMATELEAAMAKAGKVRPRIAHDHSSEYVNRDVRAMIKQHNLLDTRTRARHPESNGIVERFNGTVRDETSDHSGCTSGTSARPAKRIEISSRAMVSQPALAWVFRVMRAFLTLRPRCSARAACSFHELPRPGHSSHGARGSLRFRHGSNAGTDVRAAPAAFLGEGCPAYGNPNTCRTGSRRRVERFARRRAHSRTHHYWRLIP